MGVRNRKSRKKRRLRSTEGGSKTSQHRSIAVFSVTRRETSFQFALSEDDFIISLDLVAWLEEKNSAIPEE